MKNKFRNITVNDIEFIYRYGWNQGMRMVISLRNNKHSRVELHYPAEEPAEQIQHFWRFYEIEAIKDQEEQIIKIVGPRFISLIIKHLLSTTDVFENSKNVCIQSAWELLEEMGYEEAKPKWSIEF